MTKLSEKPVPPPRPRLDVVGTLRESVAVVRERWRVLAAVLVGPALASVVVETCLGARESWWLFLPALIVSWGLVAMMTVGCHRVVLLGPGSVEGSLGFRWTRRETRVASRWLGIVAGVLVLMNVAMLLVAIGTRALAGPDPEHPLGNEVARYLAFSPIFYFISRWSLAFPAAATDRPSRLADAWQLSLDNGWRLGAIALPTLVPYVMWMVVSPPHGASAPFPGAALVGSVLSLVLLVLGSAMTSVAFRRLGGLEMPVVPPAAPAATGSPGQSYLPVKSAARTPTSPPLRP